MSVSQILSLFLSPTCSVDIFFFFDCLLPGAVTDTETNKVGKCCRLLIKDLEDIKRLIRAVDDNYLDVSRYA